MASTFAGAAFVLMLTGYTLSGHIICHRNSRWCRDVWGGLLVGGEAFAVGPGVGDGVVAWVSGVFVAAFTAPVVGPAAGKVRHGCSLEREGEGEQGETLSLPAQCAPRKETLTGGLSGFPHV